MGEAKRRQQRGSAPKSTHRDWSKLQIPGAKVFLVSRINGAQDFTIAWEASVLVEGCTHFDRNLPPDRNGHGTRAMLDVLRQKLATVTNDPELGKIAQTMAYYALLNIDSGSFERAVRTLRTEKVFYLHAIWYDGLWIFSGSTYELSEEEVRGTITSERERLGDPIGNGEVYAVGDDHAIPKGVRKDWSKLDIAEHRVYVSARIDGVGRFTLGWDAAALATMFTKFESTPTAPPPNMDWMEMRRGQEEVRQALMRTTDPEEISPNAMILAYLGFMQMPMSDYDSAIEVIRQNEEFHIHVIYMKNQWVFCSAVEELSDEDALNLMRTAYPSKFTPLH